MIYAIIIVILIAYMIRNEFRVRKINKEVSEIHQAMDIISQQTETMSKKSNKASESVTRFMDMMVMLTRRTL